MLDMNSDKLCQEMQDVLQNNILNFWTTHMLDPHGGFYGQMLADGTVVEDASRGCILLSRILWSFSAAYRVLRRDDYFAVATHAKDYLLAHFYDYEYGGVYWEVFSTGKPLDTKKQFYALGFALYGLSEYVRATGSADTLHVATLLFETIETHARDHVYGGYIEAQTREWGEMDDMRLSELDENYPKSQNTHLHILEPYTNFLRCLRELHFEGELVDRVEEALRHLIDIFCHRILNPQTHHLDLFFSLDWTRGKDQIESYGHDIECSWLLHEAALVLGDPAILSRVEPIVRLVAQASEKGLRPDGSMIHEANLTTGHVDDDLHWWVQAETIVGFYNLYQHFGDTRALDLALRCWQYTKTHLIDYEHGEWYWSCDPQGRPNPTADKAGFWKCPYHNSRMCLELIERL